MKKLKKKKQTPRNRGKSLRLAAVLVLVSLISTACFNKGGTETVEQLQPTQTSESSTQTPESQETKGTTYEPDPSSVAPTEDQKSNSPNGGIAGGQSEPPADSDASGEPGVSPKPSANGESNGGERQAELSQAQKAEKQVIDKRVEGKFVTLRNECKAKSDSLLQSMIDELTSNEEATLKTLQSKFLGKLLVAETSCDGSFQTLVKRAADDYAKEGIPESAMPDWNSRYNEEKAAVRSSAIAKLTAAMK